MFKNLEGARLGIFVFLGTVLMVLSIFMIGNKESLFVQTYQIKTYFSSIEGLKTGAPVWLSGYNIGSVKDISLADDSTGRVEVVMNIESEINRFIRLDSEASIGTAGLVGKKIVSISPGSPDLAIVANDGIISSKNPINISKIVDESIEVIHNLKLISADFSDIVAKINKGEGTVGQLVNDEELYHSTVNIVKSANNSLENIDKWFATVDQFTGMLNTKVSSIANNIDDAVLGIKSLVDKVENGDGLVGKLISDPATYDSVMVIINNLQKTTESTKIGAFKLAENMEALKHNWLFKSYFENRGYWDASEYNQMLNDRIEEINNQNKILEQKLKEIELIKTELQSSKK